MIKGALVAALLLSFCAHADDESIAGKVPMTPDPTYTNGDYCTKEDGDFVGYRYKENVPICHRAVTWWTKDVVYNNYKISERCRKYYTVDHFVPLSMGGSNQTENLWPEHKDIKATRQNLEQALFNQLRSGQITIENALQVITQAKLNPPQVVPKGCN